MAACLRVLDEIETVDEAASVEDARAHAALPEATLVIIDRELPGAQNFVRGLRGSTRTHVIACTSRCDEQELLDVVQAGAMGLLVKETLTPEGLASAVRAAAAGTGVVAPELLSSLLEAFSRVSRDVLEPRGLSLGRLTDREQQVLSLIADGHPTREVARQLCYSERTVKNVLHDIVTKLNVRTRSQAVACAVREGLI